MTTFDCFSRADHPPPRTYPSPSSLSNLSRLSTLSTLSHIRCTHIYYSLLALTQAPWSWNSTSPGVPESDTTLLPIVPRPAKSTSLGLNPPSRRRKQSQQESDSRHTIPFPPREARLKIWRGPPSVLQSSIPGPKVSGTFRSHLLLSCCCYLYYWGDLRDR